jgi:hypothetical protein
MRWRTTTVSPEEALKKRATELRGEIIRLASITNEIEAANVVLDGVGRELALIRRSIRTTNPDELDARHKGSRGNRRRTIVSPFGL